MALWKLKDRFFLSFSFQSAKYQGQLMQKKFIKTLLKSNQTVFTFNELLLMFKPPIIKAFQSQLTYYVKQGDLIHLRRGLYAKNKNYNYFELATKIYTPSYISFETVLVKSGIVFQHYDQIFIASYQTRDIECDNKLYSFKSLKPIILTNAIGIEIDKNYSIATPERAFLDTIYLYKEYHFDHLDPLNWEKVLAMVPLYNNKTMKERVDMYYKEYKKNHIER
jgi:hypothetical protein